MTFRLSSYTAPLLICSSFPDTVAAVSPRMALVICASCAGSRGSSLSAPVADTSRGMTFSRLSRSYSFCSAVDRFTVTSLRMTGGTFDQSAADMDRHRSFSLRSMASFAPSRSRYSYTMWPLCAPAVKYRSRYCPSVRPSRSPPSSRYISGYRSRYPLPAGVPVSPTTYRTDCMAFFSAFQRLAVVDLKEDSSSSITIS